jgi:hypothetical protein
MAAIFGFLTVYTMAAESRAAELQHREKATPSEHVTGAAPATRTNGEYDATNVV